MPTGETMPEIALVDDQLVLHLIEPDGTERAWPLAEIFDEVEPYLYPHVIAALDHALATLKRRRANA